MSLLIEFNQQTSGLGSRHSCTLQLQPEDYGVMALTTMLCMYTLLIPIVMTEMIERLSKILLNACKYTSEQHNMSPPN